RAERLLAGRPRRSHRREDASPRRLELLIAGSGSPQRELLGPVPREAGVGVTVDEPRNRAQTAAVELDDVSGERPEIAHPSAARDDTVLAEQEGVVGHLDLAERLSTQGRGAIRRGHELRQVADEQAPRA